MLLALTGLCHLIPAFFALAGTVVIALLRRPAERTAVWLAGVLPVGGLLERVLGAAVLCGSATT